MPYPRFFNVLDVHLPALAVVSQHIFVNDIDGAVLAGGS
jgi:hypothetical protein